ncbi:MAG: DNA polymerase III subunit alpha [Levilactobacillus sp.]|jgi:DNA polymerase-3 subunit alpha|uniref:DNA polymerase III subunit alpha n=1 Tax=Levilactobacillus sp. TaxID=2767919 RepID=UPI0025889FE5|nr:DNA polymerase III subunit alpha [Levilactobacillus sp.]MCH4123295.1 DNA polymerase III subunit alpha [Levilactobacillus sp.]MCI1552567.1 DNA polymerase III subunit alpha [Levilactobacillus sp.]MCI1599302.1 DNA polymerase III subunit alpha [Levilactobacillus sp.]MCI1606946.1 DNA polymerase III subunit alpha [Levilactobacillus sp.]
MFVPLQVLSTYSLLQSTNRIDQLVQTAKDRGYSALALTDKNVMYGTVAFYNACIKAKIKPLLGLTLSVTGFSDAPQAHDWVLIAQDFIGYQQLMQLSTAYQVAKTAIDLSQQAENLSHLQVIAPLDSELHQLVANGEVTAAERVVHQLLALQPAGVSLGISPEVPIASRDALAQLAQATQVPLVALAPVEYLDRDDHFAVTVLRAIAAGATLTDPTAEQQTLGTHWLRPAEEEAQRFAAADLTAAVTATQQLADETDVTLKFQQPQLPQFPTPNQQPSQDYLRELCQTGLKRRLAQNQITEETPYQERLERELGVIHRMGFDDYFLIVWDVMNYAHRAHIQTGPGRGSAAGSLVAYVLAITEVDPLAYNLLFERFLNEERAQMPDIDLDIPDNRREQVLQYVHDKYGHDRVAQIITFGTLATKAALRDVGRVLGMPPYVLSEWSAAIPPQLHITLKSAYEQSQRLRNLVADSEKNRLLFETAQKIEGLPRHYSTHAAGIVLSQGPLTDLVPLQPGSEDLLMTQYPKDTVEAVGLLKMDFLGLRNLSILANALSLVKKQTGHQLDLNQIDLNDPATLRLFAQGETNGVFQFESAGIKRVLRQLKPDSFELVAAVNALYRPGPMENIDTFIRRKEGQEPISFAAEALKPILGPTYGVLVYQEQVMQVASVMGGFTLGEADLLRRAMSKKKKQTMDAMQKKFVAGAQQLGYPVTTAEQVFAYMDRFANYGFNRSHAVAYSKLAFQLAYLKAHYPAPFYAALMNSVINVPVKTKAYLTEAKRHGVSVLAPDINRSTAYFNLQGKAVIFGLSSIKGVRRDFLREVLADRQAHGPFKDLHQFLQRIDPKYRKTDLLNALVYAGAFDHFGHNRAELIAALPEFISSVELSGDNVELFAALAPKITPQPDLDLMTKLTQEEAVLGAYLSGHPVAQYHALAQQLHATTVSDLVVDARVTLILYVTKIRTIRTKRGEPMAFVTGSDETADVSVTIFPNQFRQASTWLKTDQVIVVRGKVEQQRGLQIVANQVTLAQEIPVHAAQSPTLPAGARWFIRVDATHDERAIATQLARFLTAHAGPVPVIVYQPQTDTKRVLPQTQWLRGDVTLKAPLEQLMGSGNVILQNG